MEPKTRDAGLLVKYLAERDTPCPNCAFNLRGLPGDVCPECSQRLTLRVDLTESKVGQLLAAVIGLSVGAGAAMLFLLGALAMTAKYGAPNAEEVYWVYFHPLGMALLEGILLGLLVRSPGRRWFRSGDGDRRMYSIFVAWMLTFILTMILIAGVMSL